MCLSLSSRLLRSHAVFKGFYPGCPTSKNSVYKNILKQYKQHSYEGDRMSDACWSLKKIHWVDYVIAAVSKRQGEKAVRVNAVIYLYHGRVPRKPTALALFFFVLCNFTVYSTFPWLTLPHNHTHTTHTHTNVKFVRSLRVWEIMKERLFRY